MAGVVGRNREVLARSVLQGVMGGDMAPMSGSGTAGRGRIY